jgi:hypothetical protein
VAGGDQLEEVAASLDGLAERLSDVAMDVLRDALADPTAAGVEAAKRTERVINRARSAVEKAARLTRQAAGAGGVGYGGGAAGFDDEP